MKGLSYAVVTMGATILKKYGVLAKWLSGKFLKIWVGAEIVLFSNAFPRDRRRKKANSRKNALTSHG